jgi:DNA ligase D-like protein (predicted 3'-phosphoesterase)
MPFAANLADTPELAGYMTRERSRKVAKKDPLAEYREKREFGKTPEPAGKKESRQTGPGRIFVIQKHAASTLHYDFRLEVGGVLKSWALPKGPSTNPREKRMAIATEDHPLDYADFEGIIPRGEYGAGTVMVWDTGPYRNIRAEKEEEKTSMEESLAEGKVEVWLEGRKIRGGYALVRTGRGKKEQWLLIKMKDEEADARRNPTRTQPQSAVSGRTLKEISNQAAVKRIKDRREKG